MPWCQRQHRLLPQTVVPARPRHNTADRLRPRPGQPRRRTAGFLSACSTAAPGWADALDEAIHLTSALQLAGFPHVVYTRWPIDDHLAVTVTESFHTHLTTGPPGDGRPRTVRGRPSPGDPGDARPITREPPPCGPPTSTPGRDRDGARRRPQPVAADRYGRKNARSSSA
ncbi:CHAT domain-containing protein [Streptomyces sp. NBC_00868]|uniref:CHAT domain-containing protein n=1 Tax=Streptomyces sp. NBC_00868 TaxID=2903683 RepID=UPI00386E5A98